MDKLLRDKKAIILFVAPALILFTAVLFIPIGTSFYYALCNYDKKTMTYTFIGFGNFAKLFKDPDMAIALKNSMFFLVFSCVSQLTVRRIADKHQKGKKPVQECHLSSLRSVFSGSRSSVGIPVPREGRYQ